MTQDNTSVPESMPDSMPAPTAAHLTSMLRFQIEAGVSDCLVETAYDKYSDKYSDKYRQPQMADKTAEQETRPQARSNTGTRRRADATGQHIAKAVTPQEISAADMDDAHRQARAAESLAALKQTMEGFDACPLKKTARNTVFADGNPDSDIMFIGEAPGQDEDRQGLPFVGISGQLLDRMISHIGLNRDNIYITNILAWRPPGNRNPSAEEIQLCLPFIQRHIELVAPKLIVLVGGVAAKTLLDTTQGITKLRGRVHKIKIGEQEFPTMPIFHPAYLLRNPARKAEVWRDLLAIQDITQSM